MTRWAVLVVLAACRFDAPGYEGTSYTCEAPAERCPPGFTCVDGRCTTGEGGDVDAAVDAPPQNLDTRRVEVAYDVSILSDAPTTNGAALEFLEMDAAPRRVTLIKLDLAALPTTAPVVAAELHVSVFDPLETGTFQLYPLVESWTEDGATWEQREPGVAWSGALGVPSLDANALLGEYAPRAPGPAMVALDPAIVQAWIATPATNHGFAMVSTSPDGRGGQIRSSEYAAAPAERPYVLVMLAAP